jgi:hypothetical protein
VSRQARPGRSGQSSGMRAWAGCPGQVDRYQVPVTASVPVPGPGGQVDAGLVVRPAAALRQPPGADPHPVAVDGGQQAVVPAGEFNVRRFIRAAGQEHRWPHPAALELSFVPQGRAGRSAVAETWLRNIASTPGTRAHRRRPADRAQAFPAGRTALPNGLVSDGRVGQGVPLMAGGAESDRTARCQPESHRRHASRLWRPVVLRRLQRLPAARIRAFMNPESPARSAQQALREAGNGSVEGAAAAQVSGDSDRVP